MTRTVTDKIDAVTRIPAEFLSATPPAPRSVKIELTGQCNYRCGFCALRTRADQPHGTMDPGLFRRITTEMRDAGVEEIGVFYLGESFMHPEFLAESIHWLKQDLAFPYVFLTTNGSLAHPKPVEACMRAGLDSLKFSINAATKEQFREVMGVKPSLYDHALANLRAARMIRDKGKYPCGIFASSIHYDGEQQEKMKELLAEYVLPYVDEHYWLPLYSMGSLAQQREAELGYRPIAGNQGRLAALREPLPCWSAFTEGHVTASGKLSACCFDADERWAMADLNEVDFMTGWNSATFTALRAAHLKRDVTGTPCEECVAYR